MCHTPRKGVNIPIEDTQINTFSNRYVNSPTNTDVHISIHIPVHICTSPHKHTPCLQACEYLCRYIFTNTTKIYSINVCTLLPNIYILPPKVAHMHLSYTYTHMHVYIHILTHIHIYAHLYTLPQQLSIYTHTPTHR